MLETKIIAGIDDATKCPCIGSIFIAGVAADEKTIKSWKRIGVKDSKLIARKKREKLAAIIKKTARAFAIHEITPAMIDDKTINLNAWEMVVVLHTLDQLQRTIHITQVHIDNWEVNEQMFWARLNQVTTQQVTQLIAALPIPIFFDTKRIASTVLIPEHRADENYIIAGAASLLAKTASDEQYENYKKIYGNFGSGSPADPATRLFVWQHRKKPLSIIRQSWNTYKTLVHLDDINKDPLYNRKVKKSTAC